MKFIRCLLLFLVTSSVLLPQETPAPEIAFESVPNPLSLPANLYLGEVAGVAVNSKGHIFIYTRSGHTQLHEFDASGNYIRTIGNDLYGFVFAHVVRIDKDDNIWCVDEGSNMIIKFSPEGRVLMVLGRKPEAVEAAHSPDAAPPPARPGIFNRPTDVAWDAAGNSFISDGYGNSRVAKVDQYGDWITTWGKRGAEPGEFHTPHSIATDASGNVYVGDRENRRIQVFDGDGKFLKQWTNVGAPWAICITPAASGAKQVVYSSDSVPGRIYKLDLNGNVLGAFGKAGKRPGQFGWVHEMACPSENVLYVGELLNWRMQKLILHPEKR
ncbi:MAG: peptidyl-alpha-hydroxyglycine alpha-amidating lyase family protein [Bryobacteraceae bacterium]